MIVRPSVRLSVPLFDRSSGVHSRAAGFQLSAVRVALKMREWKMQE